MDSDCCIGSDCCMDSCCMDSDSFKFDVFRIFSSVFSNNNNCDFVVSKICLSTIASYIWIPFSKSFSHLTYSSIIMFLVFIINESKDSSVNFGFIRIFLLSPSPYGSATNTNKSLITDNNFC